MPKIYLSRKRLLQIQKAKTRLWPKEVLILDSTYTVSGALTACPKRGYPRSIQGWIEWHFRTLPCSLPEVHSVLDIVLHLYNRVATHQTLKGQFNDRKRILIYNVTWTLLGYTTNQSSETLDLAHKLMLDSSFYR